MSDAEYLKLKATMPWRHELTPTAKGGIIRLLDNAGNEVPMISMINFLEFITNKISPK